MSLDSVKIGDTVWLSFGYKPCHEQDFFPAVVKKANPKTIVTSYGRHWKDHSRCSKGISCYSAEEMQAAINVEAARLRRHEVDRELTPAPYYKLSLPGGSPVDLGFHTGVPLDKYVAQVEAVYQECLRLKAFLAKHPDLEHYIETGRDRMTGTDRPDICPICNKKAYHWCYVCECCCDCCECDNWEDDK